MADGEIEACALQHLRVLAQIVIGTNADLEAFLLRPLYEGQLPIWPTGRPGIAGEVVDLDVADVRGVLRIGCARSGDATPLAGWLVQIAGRHWPLHGDMGPTRIQ